MTSGASAPNVPSGGWKKPGSDGRRQPETGVLYRTLETHRAVALAVVAALGGSRSAEAQITFDTPVRNAEGNFGWVVAAADLDGDGIREIIVGAPRQNGTRGKVYVFDITRRVVARLTMSGARDRLRQRGGLPVRSRAVRGPHPYYPLPPLR